MIHEVYGKFNEIKVCSCHFDLAFYAIKIFSRTHETDELIRAVSGKIEPCLFFFDGMYIVCCVYLVIWAANNHDGNLYEIDPEQCLNIFEDLKPINCIDWLKLYKKEIYFCFFL